MEDLLEYCKLRLNELERKKEEISAYYNGEIDMIIQLIKQIERDE